MVNKRTNCLFVVLDELDSTIKDVAFHYIVLNKYGKFFKVAPYSYLSMKLSKNQNYNWNMLAPITQTIQ
jgi:hypothetical protein